MGRWQRDGEKFLELLDARTSQAVVPKPISGTLTWATTRMRKVKSARVDKIIKVGMFEWVLYEEVKQRCWNALW